MSKTYNLEPISQSLQTAKTVLILLPQNPNLDTVAAGLALYLSLKKNSNLSLTIGCSTPMTVNFNRLFAVDKIKSHIGNQNLVIEFDYPEDSIEKISYDKDSQKCYITIEPKSGMNPLDPQSVKYSYTGSSADIIFVIGARTPEDLGALYQEEKKLLDNKTKTLVNLSHLDKNAQFGTVNIYDPTASSCSEITTSVLQGLSLTIDADIATNLLAGIEANTNNFTSPNVTADTFTLIAQLMKLGAKKGYIPQSPVPQMPQPFRPGLSQPLRQQPLPNRMPPAPFSSPKPAMPAVPPSVQSQVIPQPTTPMPSPDWLKPKVVKSSQI